MNIINILNGLVRSKITNDENEPVPVKGNVQLTGSTLAESQKTEADAISGEVTFSENIQYIQIYNRDTNDGTFTVNNIDIVMPAGEAEIFRVGGTPSPTVSVTGSTSYILGRYE